MFPMSENFGFFFFFCGEELEAIERKMRFLGPFFLVGLIYIVIVIGFVNIFE